MADFLGQLASVELRYEELTHLLSDPAVIGDSQRYTGLMKEYNNLGPLVECWRSYRKAEGSHREARELLDLPPDPVGGNVYKATFSDLYLPADEDPAEAMASLAPMDDAGAAQEGGQDVVEVEGLEGGDPALNGEGESKETVEVVGLKKQKAAEELKAVRLKDAQRLLMQAEREQGRRFEIATAKYFREQSNRIAAAVNGTQKAERSVWDILLDGVAEYDTDGAGAWYKLDEAERMSRVDAFVLGLIDWTGEESVLASIFTQIGRASCRERV